MDLILENFINSKESNMVKNNLKSLLMNSNNKNSNAYSRDFKCKLPKKKKIRDGIQLYSGLKRAPYIAQIFIYFRSNFIDFRKK